MIKDHEKLLIKFSLKRLNFHFTWTAVIPEISELIQK